MKKFKKKSTSESRSPDKAQGGPLSKIVVILGPNASGKSELGVQLALMHRGEIVSADSRQVYRDLNLTAGKVPGRWIRKGVRKSFVYKGIPHHLIDIVSPKKVFSVQQHKKKAGRTIGQILSSKKLPIVVGGTGFYIDALVYNLEIPKVPPNKKLREELDTLTTDQLMNRLKGLDSKRAEIIDPNNRRRIIRSIEIVVSSGSQIKPLEKRQSPYNALLIGVKFPDETLKERIKTRLQKRIDEGMIEEVMLLHSKKSISWNRLDELGLEFRYISQYLQGKLSKPEMQEQLQSAIWHFAKRQMTWFKKNKDIIWVDAPEKAFPIVQDFLKT